MLHAEISFCESEWQLLQNIHSALKPILSGRRGLGRRSTNLLTAETALEILVKKLDQLKNKLSNELSTGIEKKLTERRGIDASLDFSS
jgi:hypothetical protein